MDTSFIAIEIEHDYCSKKFIIHIQLTLHRRDITAMTGVKQPSLHAFLGPMSVVGRSVVVEVYTSVWSRAVDLQDISELFTILCRRLANVGRQRPFASKPVVSQHRIVHVGERSDRHQWTLKRIQRRRYHHTCCRRDDVSPTASVCSQSNFGLCTLDRCWWQ